MSFDLNQPYATICNDPLGRAFEQGGTYYKKDGSTWSAPTSYVEDIAAMKVDGSGNVVGLVRPDTSVADISGGGAGAVAFTQLTDAPNMLVPNTLIAVNNDGSAAICAHQQFQRQAVDLVARGVTGFSAGTISAAALAPNHSLVVGLDILNYDPAIATDSGIWRITAINGDAISVARRFDSVEGAVFSPGEQIWDAFNYCTYVCEEIYVDDDVKQGVIGEHYVLWNVLGRYTQDVQVKAFAGGSAVLAAGAFAVPRLYAVSNTHASSNLTVNSDSFTGLHGGDVLTGATSITLRPGEWVLLIRGSMATAWQIAASSFGFSAGGVVMLSSLPTSDPHKAGQAWSNAGVVTISAG